jgi:hypothetical protein
MVPTALANGVLIRIPFFPNRQVQPALTVVLAGVHPSGWLVSTTATLSFPE